MTENRKNRIVLSASFHSDELYRLFFWQLNGFYFFENSVCNAIVIILNLVSGKLEWNRMKIDLILTWFNMILKRKYAMKYEPVVADYLTTFSSLYKIRNWRIKSFLSYKYMPYILFFSLWLLKLKLVDSIFIKNEAVKVVFHRIYNVDLLNNLTWIGIATKQPFIT